MSYPELYNDGEFKIAGDTNSDTLPVRIGVYDTYEWASPEQATAVVNAINTALGREAVQGSVPLASSVSFNEGLLRLAAVHGKTVTFRYAKGSGATIETRRLIPTDVKQVGDHLTFTGFDPDRDEPRAYRVDRMKGEVSVA